MITKSYTYVDSHTCLAETGQLELTTFEELAIDIQDDDGAMHIAKQLLENGEYDYSAERDGVYVLYKLTDRKRLVEEIENEQKVPHLAAKTETITFQWSREHGDCYECGLPAAFYVPDAYANAFPLGEHHKRCAVCAANAAAEGERVTRIDEHFDD